jgi:tRNA (guanine37-N1)-methyltransferase
VAEHLATEEISIGNFVLSGGELPAMLVIDAVARLIPGALGNEASSQNESFSESLSSGAMSSPVGAQHPVKVPEMLGAGGTGAAPLQAETADALSCKKLESPITNHVLLDFPHYTRPAEYRGWGVPEVLIGGNHAEVAKWRRAAALEKTKRNRPDLV